MNYICQKELYRGSEESRVTTRGEIGRRPYHGFGGFTMIAKCWKLRIIFLIAF